MNKVILNLFCCFIPLKSWRKKIRQQYSIKKGANKISYPEGCSILIHTKNGETIQNPKRINGISIYFRGKNNTVEIFESSFHASNLILKNNCHFIFNRMSAINLSVMADKGAKLTILEGTSINGATVNLEHEENNFLFIGKDCMLSYEILFWPSDAHTIIDKETSCVINKAHKGITIGNHVWIGQRAVFLKQTSVADNSIVGAASVVTKSFDEKNIIIAGNPAKKIKSGIDWKRESPV